MCLNTCVLNGEWVHMHIYKCTLMISEPWRGVVRQNFYVSMYTCKGFPQITQIILSIVLCNTIMLRVDNAMVHLYDRHLVNKFGCSLLIEVHRVPDWSTHTTIHETRVSLKFLPHEHFIQSVSEAGLQREYNWSKEKKRNIKAFSLHLAIPPHGLCSFWRGKKELQWTRYI